MLSGLECMTEHPSFFQTKGIPPTTVIGEVTNIKEKLRILEVWLYAKFNCVKCKHLQRSHVNLKRRVSEQAEEIQRLRSSSADISSASEVLPDYSPPQKCFGRTDPSLKPSTDSRPVSCINLVHRYFHIFITGVLERGRSGQVGKC